MSCIYEFSTFCITGTHIGIFALVIVLIALGVGAFIRNNILGSDADFNSSKPKPEPIKVTLPEVKKTVVIDSPTPAPQIKVESAESDEEKTEERFEMLDGKVVVTIEWHDDDTYEESMRIQNLSGLVLKVEFDDHDGDGDGFPRRLLISANSDLAISFSYLSSNFSIDAWFEEDNNEIFDLTRP